VSVVCCAGRDLCDGLITRPEDSNQLLCVVLCDLENLMNEEAMAHWEGCRVNTKQTKYSIIELKHNIYVDCRYN